MTKGEPGPAYASTLVLEDYPEANLQWCQDQDIQFMVSPRGQ